ncbi:MAG TPA: 4-alpha-glucanotransferase [Terriglobales bacterium]|nr:4-alpha-glucanotransferase [Terriglobales bacterium]
MNFERLSGILLHPTSLPAAGGIGDFGPAAYEFLDFLAAARQGLWQVLPLGPLGAGGSPYSSTSAFAGNPLLISLHRLAERGWIDAARLAALPPPGARVDYTQVRSSKLPLLFEAADNFLGGRDGGHRSRFERFCREQAGWLDDAALFGALRRRHNLVSWNRWPAELARRQPAALDQARRELAAEIDRTRVLQFAFYEQWRALRRACAQRGIRILGDLAIFVNYDSADVWTHPDLFKLDAALEPEVVAGVPPDAFSASGQRWGNPVYRWDVLKARGYDWWVERMRWACRACDIIRLDHFRGFEKYWEIPAAEPTAVHGRWVAGPGDDLFQVLGQGLGELPFIAEDLGFITPEVHALRRRLNIPGMRVMQFGFGDPGAHIYLPHKFEPNTVVYTGTHDNDTLVGWWKTGATDGERRAVRAYFGEPADGIHWAFIRAAAASVAELCVVPMQDVLGLDGSARMNVPSRSEGNWSWRLSPEALTPELAQKLADLATASDRIPSVREVPQRRRGETEEEPAA